MHQPFTLSSMPTVIPFFPLANALLLPQGQLPLNIFEPRYLQMVDDALAGNRMFGMIQPVDGSGDQGSSRNLHKVGCLGRITQFSETDDGRYLITLTGLCRYAIEQEMASVTAYRQAEVSYQRFARDLNPSDTKAIDRTRLLGRLKDYLDRNDLEADWEAINHAGSDTLVNSLCMIAPFGISEKQALLEAETVTERSEVLMALFEMAIAGPGDNGEPPLH